MSRAKTTVKNRIQDTTPPRLRRLGTLSAKYESGRRGAAAVGFDRTGGWSYGKYQIATRTGTMRSFLRYIEPRSPTIAKRLAEAGGFKAAMAGEQRFKAAWIKAATDPSFEMLQHDYIRDTHYRPLAASLERDLGIKLEERSYVLQDVVWSTSVQHGAGSKVIQNALKGKVIESLSDEEIINAVYEERGKEVTDSVGNTELKYFRSSSKPVQDDIRKRFQDERQCAKQMLDAQRANEERGGGDAEVPPETLWI